MQALADALAGRIGRIFGRPPVRSGDTPRRPGANLDWNLGPSVALRGMFFFFSNGIGVAGSIFISISLSLLLLYACSH
jgi:hypothetical protein